MKKITLFLSIIILFTLTSFLVNAAPYQYNITEDVIVRSGASANTNLNGIGLSVKAAADVNFCRMTMLKANLTSYTGTIADAELCMYITIQQSGQNVSVYNYSYSTTWDETTATFNSIQTECSNCLDPTDSTNGQWTGAGQRYGTTHPTDTDINTWKCVNITGVPKTYFSMVMVDDVGENINFVGQDSEGTNKPYINITGPVPTGSYNSPSNGFTYNASVTSTVLNATYVDPDGNNGEMYFYFDAVNGTTLVYNTSTTNNTAYNYTASITTGNTYFWKVAVNNTANPNLIVKAVQNFTVNMTNGTILFFDEGLIAWTSYGSRGNPSIRVDSNESARIFNQYPNPGGANQPYNVSYLVYNITGNSSTSTNDSILFYNDSAVAGGTGWIPETPQTFTTCGINYSVDGMMNASNYDNQHKLQLRNSTDGGLTYPNIMNDSIFGTTQAYYFGYDAQVIDENNTWLYVATTPISGTAAVYRIIFNCSGMNTPLNVFNETASGIALTGRLTGFNVEKFGSTYYLYYGNSKEYFRYRTSADGTTWSNYTNLFYGNSEWRNSVFSWSSQYFLFINDDNETNITVYNMSSPTSFSGAVYQKIYYNTTGSGGVGYYLGFDSVKKINDTSFLIAVSNRSNRYILVDKWSTTALPTDSCTPPVSGQWDLLCSDSCSFTSLQTVPGNLNITGTGTINISAGGWNMTAASWWIRVYDSVCRILLYDGAKIIG